LVLLAAVVLPAQGLHAMTKLLELLVTRAWSDPCLDVLWTAMCTMTLYPSDFWLRTDATLGQTYSVMQWQINCPSLRVTPLTPNLYSYSFV
jgi:hypothetical protein